MLTIYRYVTDRAGCRIRMNHLPLQYLGDHHVMEETLEDHSDIYKIKIDLESKPNFSLPGDWTWAYFSPSTSIVLNYMFES